MDYWSDEDKEDENKIKFEEDNWQNYQVGSDCIRFLRSSKFHNRTKIILHLGGPILISETVFCFKNKEKKKLDYMTPKDDQEDSKSYISSNLSDIEVSLQ